jgi:uncharacterized protein YjbI with pentapeptide repeats
MTPEDREILRTWWHPHYLHAARTAYPGITAGHDLAVGWKLTSVTGRTHGGYYWPLVDGDHDQPVFHQATAWDDRNAASCPAAEGDGLCLVTTSLREASSGGARLTSSTGHVLVYPADLARSDTVGKHRVPWCIDVDTFDPTALIRDGFLANLSWANLSGADLSWANLSGANLSRADLSGADLSGANLSGANLSWANLSGANLSWADLSWANLSGANLSWADLGSWRRDGATGMAVRA